MTYDPDRSALDPSASAEVQYPWEPVRLMGLVVPVSDEVLTDTLSIRDLYQAYMRMTPEEREAAAQRMVAERAAERAVPRVPLTMSALLDKLYWSEEYAAHLVQPYCTCSQGSDGWDYCQHAVDLNLT